MLKPKKDKIILEEIKDEDVKDYGILVSCDDKKTKLIKAVVRAVDPQSEGNIKVGDVVYIGQYQACDYEHDNKKYLIVDVNDVACEE